MTNIAQEWQDIARSARSGRNFFAEAAPRARESEISAAFGYVADVKARLIDNLATWTATSAEGAGRHSPTVAAVEKLYADAARHFRPEAPASVAHALAFGEDQLLRLTEHAFETARTPVLRQLLKQYYSEISICRQTMSRLQARLAA